MDINKLYELEAKIIKLVIMRAKRKKAKFLTINEKKELLKKGEKIPIRVIEKDKTLKLSNRKTFIELRRELNKRKLGL